ncbi:hypothetical protein ACET3Z_012642 [Daucus carota]
MILQNPGNKVSKIQNPLNGTSYEEAAAHVSILPSCRLILSLMTKKIKGLFFSGQLNGTTGYEEAATQHRCLPSLPSLYQVTIVPHAEKRFRLHVVAYDQTGKLDVIISDHEVYEPHRFIGYRARDVIPEGALPAFFPNHHIALAFNRSGTSLPSTWSVMTSLAPPISSFPMNTAGVHFLRPNALSSLSSCGPFGCSSSSWTLGFAPNVWISFMMLWDMQQDVLLKITTGVDVDKNMDGPYESIFDNDKLTWNHKSNIYLQKYLHGKFAHLK